MQNTSQSEQQPTPERSSGSEQATPETGTALEHIPAQPEVSQSTQSIRNSVQQIYAEAEPAVSTQPSPTAELRTPADIWKFTEAAGEYIEGLRHAA